MGQKQGTCTIGTNSNPKCNYWCKCDGESKTDTTTTTQGPAPGPTPGPPGPTPSPPTPANMPYCTPSKYCDVDVKCNESLCIVKNPKTEQIDKWDWNTSASCT